MLFQQSLVFDLWQYLFFLFSVLNCVRLLTRFVPYIFEDPDWRGFFWSTVPGQDVSIANNYLLANTSVTAISGVFHNDFFYDNLI